MRILIAGWHGQIAQALSVAAMRAPAVSSVAIGRPALDLCAPAGIAAALVDGRPDVIINTAAYTGVDAAEDDPVRARRMNTDGAGMIAAEARRRGAAIIHLSTEHVFDGRSDRAYRASDPTNPRSVFGATKRDGERAVAAANPWHVIVRTSWVHSGVGKNFARTMIERARRLGPGATVRVVDDQTGCPTYAPHLADALIAISIAAAEARLQDAPGPWGTVHAAGAGATSWAGFARHLFAVSGAAGGPTATVEPIEARAYPTRAPRPANGQLDCVSLAAAFGVQLPSWQEGVAACVQDLLSEPA